MRIIKRKNDLKKDIQDQIITQDKNLSDNDVARSDDQESVKSADF